MRTLSIAILGTFLLSLFGVENADAAERGLQRQVQVVAAASLIHRH